MCHMHACNSQCVSSADCGAQIIPMRLLIALLLALRLALGVNVPCSSQSDLATLSNNASEIGDAAQNCGLDCEWQEGCMSVCIARKYLLSGDCSFCYAKGYKNCRPMCHADPNSAKCKACSRNNYAQVIQDCSAAPLTAPCYSSQDVGIVKKNYTEMSDAAGTCGYDCEQHEGCMSVCLSRKMGISGECAYCYAKGFNRCDPVTCPRFEIVARNCTTLTVAQVN